MKFIRQADMNAHYVEDGKELWIPPIYCEELLVEAWLAGNPSGLALQVEGAPDGAFFDPGGMVMGGEAEIWVVVGAQRIGCHLRGAESLLPLLRRRSKWREGAPQEPPHTFIRGAYKHVLLTPATADAAADLIEAEWRVRVDECDGLWAQRAGVLRAAGVLDRRAEKNPRYPNQV